MHTSEEGNPRIGTGFVSQPIGTRCLVNESLLEQLHHGRQLQAVVNHQASQWPQTCAIACAANAGSDKPSPLAVCALEAGLSIIGFEWIWSSSLSMNNCLHKFLGTFSQTLSMHRIVASNSGFEIFSRFSGVMVLTDFLLLSWCMSPHSRPQSPGCADSVVV